MSNGNERYVEAIGYLGQIYDFLNEKIFNSELSKPVITVQRDERNKSFGWWTVKKVWKWNDKVPANCATCKDNKCPRDSSAFVDCMQFINKEEYELNISAQGLNRSTEDIAETLLHEMCHQYATLHEVQDTSRSGKYHNKLFKSIAEKHGLACMRVEQTGWSATVLTTETKNLIKPFIEENQFCFIYRLPVQRGQALRMTSTRKYVCPCCANSCRATKELRLMCVDCNELMTIEN